MKKTACLLASLMMLLGSTAFAQNYTPGTYVGESGGRNGVVKVEAEYSADAIVSAKVIEHSETPGISDAPIAQLPEEYVKYQSLGLDVISGATLTSNAILAALEQTAAAAGADVEALKAAPVEAKTAGEDEVLSADIVVVGAGGAGLAAAVSASEQGASVIVLEKTVAVGGNTLRSGGWYNSADQERQKNLEMSEAQKATVEAMLAKEAVNEKMAQLQKTLQTEWDAYKAEGGTYLFDSPTFHALQTYDGGDYLGNIDLIAEYANEAPNTLKWLESLGMQTNPTVTMCVGALWQRSHSVVGNTNVGYGYIETVHRAAEEKGVQILFETRGTELMTDENNAVIGVRAEKSDGTKLTVNAAKGVILATGGFGGDLDKVREIRSDIPETIKTTSSSACTGDGIWMAQAIGAEAIDLDQIQLYPLASAVDGSTGYAMVGPTTAMYVNAKGERYVNENERRDVLAAAAFAQGGVIYCISDSVAAQNTRDIDVVNYAVEQGAAYRADTLEELAEQLGMDPAVLVDTVNKFNSYVDAQSDPDFGRTIYGPNLKVETAPFYASPRSPSVHHTMGGLKIDGQTRVYNTDGEIIKGLYAAGETTGGLHGSNRLGGNAVSDALTFGRIAGETAATEN